LDLRRIPAYVINLKERPDRWKRFTDQPAVHGLRRLRRLHAVNGKGLRWRTDKRISLHTKLNIFRNYRRSHYEIATLGAVGSSLSHIAAWRKFVASGAPVCLVLEDDAILTEDQVKKVEELSANAPTDWAIWLLGLYKPNTIFQDIEGTGWRQIHSFTAAHAYLLRREAALKLLEEPFPIETHIEYYITGSATLKEFKVVEHPDIHIEFFRKERDKPRVYDSNTSQHKKGGCPTCNIPDDYKQFYRGATRRKKSEGMQVNGLVETGQQGGTIRMLRSAANTRKNRRNE
jgi:GR25 family glycosyltransferase involved in LPS biosynthesis